ncbi:MAG: hypothetical protein AAFR61_07910 [Bacteroidota bacterium]
MRKPILSLIVLSLLLLAPFLSQAQFYRPLTKWKVGIHSQALVDRVNTFKNFGRIQDERLLSVVPLFGAQIAYRFHQKWEAFTEFNYYQRDIPLQEENRDSRIEFAALRLVAVSPRLLEGQSSFYQIPVGVRRFFPLGKDKIVNENRGIAEYFLGMGGIFYGYLKRSLTYGIATPSPYTKDETWGAPDFRLFLEGGLQLPLAKRLFISPQVRVMLNWVNPMDFYYFAHLGLSYRL